MATPIVSGAAAWVWTARPDLDNTQLFEIMRRSATDVPPTGRDDASGYGLLDVPAALAYPAPPRDPLEPNDDLDFVRPGSGFFSGLGPLTTRSSQGATITARLDRFEDPRDVYRIFLPARKAVRVTATSKANVELRVWGPGTVTVADENSGPTLLGRDVRTGVGRKHVLVEPAQTGRWAYVEVTLGGHRGVAAAYSLTVRS